ncbi:MAG: ATP synthase F0 subunit C [Deltaproteobacteria bacterium]|nr:ATP synthase F0 subunit C [Deltaproteobacteria bacterium]
MVSRNLKFALSMLSGLFVMLIGAVAFAQEHGGAGDNEFTMKAWIGLACGLGIGIAAFGGALGQGRTASAALDGIARNPGASGKIFTPMILGLALIESLVIYSLIISILLMGKI